MRKGKSTALKNNILKCYKCGGEFTYDYNHTGDTDKIREQWVDNGYRDICHACHSEYLTDLMIQEYGGLEEWGKRWGVDISAMVKHGITDAHEAHSGEYKLYDLKAVEKLIDEYCGKGGGFSTLNDGALLDDYIMFGPELKTCVAKARALNEWSSAYTLRFYNKTPEKYAEFVY